MSPGTVERVGVVGAGTMGAGIAQIAALGGYRTVVYEVDGTALERGLEQLRNRLRRGAERGGWSAADAADAFERIETDTIIEILRDCELVIEAAPEDLDLKRNLFERLVSVCRPDSVLATNTSSLSVTAIASVVPKPERIVGMHFFNTPALMRLVEIVAGDESGDAALELGMLQQYLGKRQGTASHDEIDRIVRLGAGLRMGPFELMDLIGIDVNFAVARSFWEQSFGEPRWRPSPIHERMVASGRLGRKTGRGFYHYGLGTRDG